MGRLPAAAPVEASDAFLLTSLVGVNLLPAEVDADALVCAYLPSSIHAEVPTWEMVLVGASA